MMRTVLRCMALFVVAWISAAPVVAQDLTSGALAGKVSDPSGKAIAGAIVLVTSLFGTKTA